MADRETGERGFLITGEESFLQPFNQGTTDFTAATSDLRVHIRANYNADERRSKLDSVASIELLARKWLEQAAQPEIDARRRINQTSVNTLQYIQTVLLRGTGKNILDQIRGIFDELQVTFNQSNQLQASGLVMQLAKAMVDSRDRRTRVLDHGRR